MTEGAEKGAGGERRAGPGAPRGGRGPRGTQPPTEGPPGMRGAARQGARREDGQGAKSGRGLGGRARVGPEERQAARLHSPSAPAGRPRRPSAARRRLQPGAAGKGRSRERGPGAEEAAPRPAAGRGHEEGRGGRGPRRPDVERSPLARLGLRRRRPSNRGARGLCGRRRPRPGQHHPAAGPSHRRRSTATSAAEEPARNRRPASCPARPASMRSAPVPEGAPRAALPASHRSRPRPRPLAALRAAPSLRQARPRPPRPAPRPPRAVRSRASVPDPAKTEILRAASTLSGSGSQTPARTGSWRQ